MRLPPIVLALASLSLVTIKVRERLRRRTRRSPDAGGAKFRLSQGFPGRLALGVTQK
jgi:hypothetical protein